MSQFPTCAVWCGCDEELVERRVLEDAHQPDESATGIGLKRGHDVADGQREEHLVDGVRHRAARQGDVGRAFENGAAVDGDHLLGVERLVGVGVDVDTQLGAGQTDAGHLVLQVVELEVARDNVVQQQLKFSILRFLNVRNLGKKL